MADNDSNGEVNLSEESIDALSSAVHSSVTGAMSELFGPDSNYALAQNHARLGANERTLAILAQTDKIVESLDQISGKMDGSNGSAVMLSAIEKLNKKLDDVKPDSNSMLEGFKNIFSSDVKKGIFSTGSSSAGGTKSNLGADSSKMAMDAADRAADRVWRDTELKPLVKKFSDWLDKQKDNENGTGAGVATASKPGLGTSLLSTIMTTLVPGGLGVLAGANLPPGVSAGLGGALRWLGGKADGSNIAAKVNRESTATYKKNVKNSNNELKQAKEELKQAKRDAAEAKSARQNAEAESAKAKRSAKAAETRANKKLVEAEAKVERAKTARAEAVKAKPTKLTSNAGKVGKVVGKVGKVAGAGMIAAPAIMAGVDSVSKYRAGDKFGAATAATRGAVDLAANAWAPTRTANMAIGLGMMGLKKLGVADSDSPESLGEIIETTANGLNQHKGWIFGNEREKQVSQMAAARNKDLMAMVKIGLGDGGIRGEENKKLAEMFMSSDYFNELSEPYQKLAEADAKEKTSMFFKSDKYAKQMESTQQELKRRAQLFGQQYRVLSKEYGEEGVAQLMSRNGGADALLTYMESRYALNGNNATGDDFDRNLKTAKDTLGRQIRGEEMTAKEQKELETATSRGEVNSDASAPEQVKTSGSAVNDSGASPLPFDFNAFGSVLQTSLINALLDPRVQEMNMRNSENMGNVLSGVMVGG